MSHLIDNPKDLMKLSREELDEILLDKYKNTGLLRELLRRCLSSLKEQTELTEYYKQGNIEEQLDDLKNEINEVIEKYRR